MGYKILEIEEGYSASFSLDNIIIKVNDKKARIPINDIDIVLINNIQSVISMRLVNELANRNILTIICDDKHLPNAFILPISGHYNSLKKIQKQYEWTNEFKNNKWNKIIILKINSQIELINHLGINNNEIRENIANEVSNGDEFNIEARVASKYFPILFGKSFIRKNEDTEFNKYVNSFLNYGYTILLSIVCRSIVKNGYDTRIGIFHKSFSNHTALGSDLMEPFRVIVDCAVYNLIRKLKQLDFFLSSDVKRKLIELFNKQIIYNKERINITLCIDKYVQDILDNDLKIEIEYLFDEY